MALIVWFLVCLCPVLSQLHSVSLRVLFYGRYSISYTCILQILIRCMLAQLGLFHHLFVDDVQAHIHTNPRDAETVLTQMSRSIDALTAWMASNRFSSILLRFRPYGLVAAGNLPRLTLSGSPLSFLT